MARIALAEFFGSFIIIAGTLAVATAQASGTAGTIAWRLAGGVIGTAAFPGVWLVALAAGMRLFI